MWKTIVSGQNGIGGTIYNRLVFNYSRLNIVHLTPFQIMTDNWLPKFLRGHFSYLYFWNEKYCATRIWSTDYERLDCNPVFIEGEEKEKGINKAPSTYFFDNGNLETERSFIKSMLELDPEFWVDFCKEKDNTEQISVLHDSKDILLKQAILKKSKND